MSSSAAYPADGLVVSARRLIAQGRDVEAAELLANAFHATDDRRRVASLLAEVARAAPQPTARLVAARALMELAPDHAGPWRQLADLAMQASDFAGAACAWAKAAARPGGDDGDRLAAATAAYLANDLDGAARLYGAVRQRSPDVARGLADIALARGDRVAAEAILREALARWPDAVTVLTGLADLGAGEEVRPGIDRIARDKTQPEPVRAAAAFAMAGMSDREDDPRSAMCWANYANRLSSSGRPRYRREAEDAALERLLALDDLMGEAHTSVEERIQPLVIVGAPRSGTSIIESLLTAHPEVSAGGERTDLAMAAREFEIIAASHGIAAAASAFEARRPVLRDWIEARLSRAGLYGPRYTDKLPQNLLNVGLIARIFPSARIIGVRRDPRETALSIYLLNFAEAYPYATDLDDLVHAMRLADRALVEWQARLGDRMLLIDHESFCADPAGQGRRLYDHCGLAWSDSYLDPARRAAPMRTFSALQVRDEISPRPPRWPRYQPWISPLLAAFGTEPAAPTPMLTPDGFDLIFEGAGFPADTGARH